jgi:Family of unknown function (DUF6350)
VVSLLARLPRRGTGDGRHAIAPGWLAIAAACAVTVAGLAGLGLAVVVVNTLDPTGGLPVAGSLALAGRLWLLAQGGGLSLASGPLVLAPLLLTLGIAWGLSRAGRGVVRARDLTESRATAAVAGIAAVHLVLTLLLAALLDTPEAGVAWLRTGVGAALLAVLAAGWGAGRESGLLDGLLDRFPATTRPVLRGALAGVLAAVALCAVVVAVAVASDARGYAVVSGSLGGAGAGAVGLLGLALLLLPNAAAAVLGLAAGPGFVVGAATTVSVHGVTLGPVPALPLLAALPDTQAVPLVAFVSQVIPALAGVVAGVVVARRFRPDDGGAVVAGLAGIAAGVLMGVLSGALVRVAGGSLGDGGLAEVGAPAVPTALAVAAQSGIAAALAAAVTRWRSAA